MFCRAAQTVSVLFARGYTVMPEPQKVVLGAKDFTFDQSWQLKLDKSVPANDVAVETLREDLESRFHLTLWSGWDPGGVLSLVIAPSSVQIGQNQDSDKSALEEQAYRITCTAER